MRRPQPFSDLLPSGWHLTHLILLDPEWQAIVKDEEHVAIGTGDTYNAAIHAATCNVMDGKFAGRLFHLPRERSDTSPAPHLLASLGLVERPIHRRKV